MFKVDGVACVMEDDGDDTSEFWVEFQGLIDTVYRVNYEIVCLILW